VLPAGAVCREEVSHTATYFCLITEAALQVMVGQKLRLGIRASRILTDCTMEEASVLHGSALKREASGCMPLVARSFSSMRSPPFGSSQFPCLR
jgi:hypothetical protein